MWLIRTALSRPYTFIVLAVLILIVSPIAILRTPTDIFPNIDIPVIAIVWNYNGLNPEEIEGRLTSVFERVLTTLPRPPPFPRPYSNRCPPASRRLLF